MSDPGSRYHDLAVLTLVARGRDATPYLARRFCPAGNSLPLLLRRTAHEGDRLDTLAATLIGDARQAWRIADANDAMNPRTLVSPGRRLRIPVPEI
jgi:hypothetical protein